MQQYADTEQLAVDEKKKRLHYERTSENINTCFECLNFKRKRTKARRGLNLSICKFILATNTVNCLALGGGSRVLICVTRAAFDYFSE